jgi:hypothetical protein
MSHCWHVLSSWAHWRTTVPFAVAQLSGWTAVPLLTLVMVYGVPVAGNEAGTWRYPAATMFAWIALSVAVDGYRQRALVLGCREPIKSFQDPTNTHIRRTGPDSRPPAQAGSRSITGSFARLRVALLMRRSPSPTV